MMSHNTDLYRAMIESSNDDNEQEATSPHVPVGNQGPPHVPDRPPDEFIIAQQNEIRDETSAVPYVGDLVPLLDLEAEYASGNAVFVGKIKWLSSSFGSMRRTRGDGNCFYRAFAYAYLEGLLLDFNLDECKRFIECVKSWHQKLMDSHFQALVFEDAQELLLDQVEAIGRENDPMTTDLLLVNLRDDCVSNMIVMFLRMITSAELQRRQEFFAPFIMGMFDEAPSVEYFCQRYVEVQGEESDHVHIVALSDALQIPVKVVYLDRSASDPFGGSSSDLEADTYDFVPEGASSTAKAVTLLYRPGHYDILYSK